MQNQTTGTNTRTFDPGCHQITVFCKRIDRALDRIARANTLLFTTHSDYGYGAVIIRYALPLIRRVKFIDDKGHKFRVTGKDDSRYMPISYGEVGSKGLSGICWTAEVRIHNSGVVTTEYTDKYLYSYPRLTQYPLIDFSKDHDVDLKLQSELLLRNAGIFIDTLHDSVEFDTELQYKEDIDSIPQLLANPRNSAKRVAQILRDHFNADVGVDLVSTVIDHLPNKERK